ncbi:MAG: MFS transporter [Rikenellaceae bacterium]|nr:MFS transporter [Rikenellaceae bacterium]
MKKLEADIEQTENKPQLTRGLLWLITIGAGLVLANLYYNQPLLSHIAADFGVSESAASKVAMITQLGYAAGLFFIVPLGDMMRRKKIILVDFGFMLLALFAVALSPSFSTIIIASFFLGLTTIIPQIFLPLTAQLSRPEETAKSMAMVVSGMLIGMLASRVFSGILAEYFGWRAVYLVAMCIMLILGLCMALFLPEIKPTFKGTYRELMLSILYYVKTLPDLRMAALRGGLVFGSFSMLWATLAFRLNGAPFLAGSDVAGAMGLVGIVGAVAANVVGRITNKYGQNRILTAGASVMLLSWVILGLGGSTYAGIIAGVILIDMGIQAMNISNQSLIFSSHKEATNRINTAYMVTFFIGGAVGTWIGGLIWGLFGWTGVTFCGGLFILLCLLFHLSYLRKEAINR